MPLMSESPFGEQLAPVSAWPPGWRAPDDLTEPRRPGTVLAAAIVTWSAAGLTLLGAAAALVFVLWLGAPVFEAFDGSRAVALVVIGVSVVWSSAACLLAHRALAGRNWARMALAGSSALTVVASTMMFWLALPVLTLLGAIAVLVLLFIGGANEWYRTQRDHP
jgi:hypothetical protein